MFYDKKLDNSWLSNQTWPDINFYGSNLEKVNIEKSTMKDIVALNKVSKKDWRFHI